MIQLETILAFTLVGIIIFCLLSIICYTLFSLVYFPIIIFKGETKFTKRIENFMLYNKFSLILINFVITGILTFVIGSILLYVSFQCHPEDHYILGGIVSSFMILIGGTRTLIFFKKYFIKKDFNKKNAYENKNI